MFQAIYCRSDTPCHNFTRVKELLPDLDFFFLEQGFSRKLLDSSCRLCKDIL
jgi:hypothetical protein